MFSKRPPIDLGVPAAKHPGQNFPSFRRSNHTVGAGAGTAAAPVSVFNSHVACTVQWIIVQTSAACSLQMLLNGQPFTLPLSVGAGAIVRFAGTLLTNNESLALSVSANSTLNFEVVWVKELHPDHIVSDTAIIYAGASTGAASNVDIFDSIGNQILASTATTSLGAMRIEGTHSTGDLGAKFLVIGGLASGQAIPLLLDNTGRPTVNINGLVEVDGSSGAFPIEATNGASLQSNGAGALQVAPVAPINGVTGDNPTLTTTAQFNGATQTTPPGYRGVFITAFIGTVTGTSPTLTMTLQWSPDGGTTWFSIGATPANAVSSASQKAILCYPTIQPNQNSFTNFNNPIPLTWRNVLVAGGTGTLSIPITKVATTYMP